jgi:MOSC domain-containing protein YiiM
MRVLSVNISGAREVEHNGRIVGTGIFKEPVAGRVRVTRRTLEGDRQVDLRVHGGVDKAVYAYPHEHYAVWASEEGRDDFAPGQFGENLTTEGLLEEDVRVGDRFRIGTALLEVTQPRVPCYKLGIKMGDPTFPKRFLASGRSGWYLRVLEEGDIGAGDPIDRVRVDPAGITISDLYRLRFGGEPDREMIRRVIDIEALSGEWRKEFMTL